METSVAYHMKGGGGVFTKHNLQRDEHEEGLFLFEKFLVAHFPNPARKAPPPNTPGFKPPGIQHLAVTACWAAAPVLRNPWFYNL